jgi:hypothetical protein
VATYPFIQLCVKLISMAFKHSHLMHISHVYFFVRLHKIIAHWLWAIFLYCAWVYIVEKYATLGKEYDTVRRIIACHLAWKSVW